MKKLLIAAVLSLLPLTALAHNSTEQVVHDWVDSVTTNGAISRVIDAREADSIIFEADSGTTTLPLSIACTSMTPDHTGVLFSFPDVTLTTGSKFNVVIDPNITVPSSAPTGTTYITVPPCPWMTVSIPAEVGTFGADVRVTTTVRRAVPGRNLKAWYESGSVIAGAALATPVFDTSKAASLVVIAEATTTNRTLVVSCTDKLGNITYSLPALTVTQGQKFLRDIRADAVVPGTEVTNVLHIPITLCRYMKANIAAAGAASAKLSAYLR